MTRLDDLKRQLAELDGLLRDGVLTSEGARSARDRLEAEILAAVLQPTQAGAGVAAGVATAPIGQRAADAKVPAGPPSAIPPDVIPPSTQPSGRLVAGLGVFMLVFTAAGYAWLGNPAALATAPGVQATAKAVEAGGDISRAQFEAMAERLAERLKAKPDDPEGWSMLGRSYSVLEMFPQAASAFQQVVAQRPQDAQGYADYADALGMTQGRKLAGEPEKLIARALQLDPDNVKALSLSGTLAVDRGDAAGAAQLWAHALRKTEPGSEMAQRLQGAIDDARQRAGLPTAAASASAVATATAEAASALATASVQVRISLAPALAAKAGPEDTVFIFARALQGGKAPLAIQRRQVKDLPLQLTLDDSMAMSPALRLSSVSQVIVGARVSKSGNAMPQPGDLQGLTPAVAVGARGLQLQIAEVLP
jgi:cytochrome c-type biogenesis protein CcmH